MDDIFSLLSRKTQRAVDDRSPGVGTFAKDVPLSNLHPHYTNEYYKHARSVFGKETKGISYDYSDRLWEWDYEKSKAAFEVANSSQHKKDSANYFEVYLSEYFGKPVEILHILAGFNWANGYPYQVFGYKFI